MATTRRSFTDEFKREAVSLLASSGRPLTQVAAELGIQPSMLRSWRGAVNGAATATPGPGTAPVPPAASAEQAEIRRLRRELERAQMERDILKTSALTHSEGAGSLASLVRMVSAGLVQTNGLAALLWSRM